MYPHELEHFIKERNGYIGGDDLIRVVNIKENPQIVRIKYDNYNNKYEIWDRYNNYYRFTPMPYEEAKVRKLVKKR